MADDTCGPHDGPSPDNTDRKACKICKSILVRRPGEQNNWFRERLTCSPECANIARYRAAQSYRHDMTPDRTDWTRLKKPWPADLWYGDQNIKTE